MHVDDLRRVAPLWLKYTEDVRFDPDVRQSRGGRDMGAAGARWAHAGLPSALSLPPLCVAVARPAGPARPPCPQAWELTGDAYSTHKGDRPWISEM